MADDVEVLFDVGISVAVVFPDAVAWQLGLRCFVEAGGQGIGLRLANSRKAAPAAGIVPFFAIAGSVDVEGDQEDLVEAEMLADLIDASAALGEGNVFTLGNQELDIEAQGHQLLPNAEGEVAVVGVFTEVPVRATFARRIIAVAIVEEDLHSCRH